MGKLAEILSAVRVIAADLETSVDLPEHKAASVYRPPYIAPEHCPLLVTWIGRVPWRLAATPSHYVTETTEVNVGWFEGASKERETLDGFDALSSGLFEIGDLIVDRLVTYSEGLPPGPNSGNYARIIATTVEHRRFAERPTGGIVLGVVTRMELER